MNLNKLKAKIVEQGKTKAELARYIGISPQALNLKLRGKIRISTDDAYKACEFLNIETNEERAEIFLS